MFEFNIEKSWKTKWLEYTGNALKVLMFGVFIVALYKIQPILGLGFLVLFGVDFVVDMLKLNSSAQDYMRSFERAQEKLEKDIYNSGHC